jgi:hypothetical protein
MRKLIVAMMELVILIVIEVKANNLFSTSLNPPSLPIPLPNPSKLDNVESLFHTVLKKELAKCEKFEKRKEFEENARCILKSFFHCFRQPLHSNDRAYHIADECLLKCEKKITHTIHYANCVLECYEDRYQED